MLERPFAALQRSPPVGARAFIAFGALIAAILAVGLVSLNLTARTDADLQRLFTDRLPRVELARSALRLSHLNSRLVLQIFLLEDPAAIKPLLEERAKNTATITKIHEDIFRRLDSPEERSLLEAIRAARNPYVASYLRALAILLNDKDTVRARQVLITETLPLINTYHAAVQDFVDHEGAQMALESTRTHQRSSAARKTVTVLLFAAVVFALAIGFAATASIVAETRKRRFAEEQLRASHEALERRIRERTGELALVNEELTKDAGRREKAQTELRKLSRAVEQSPVSIVITNTAANIEYVNPKFTRVTGYTASEVLGMNPRILKSGEQPPEVYQELWETITSGGEWCGEFHNRKKNGDLFWELACISPIIDDQQKITHFLAVKEDITERKVAEGRIRQLNRLLRTISEVNQLIVRAEDKSALLSEACRALVEQGGFLMVWVGFADAASGLVVPAARAGKRTHYLDGLVIRFDDSQEGRGPMGTAIRTGGFGVVDDVETDPSAAPWRERMLAHGFSSVAAFPLRSHGTVTGALAVYASKAHALGDEEKALLGELAGDLGFALEAIENRENRRQAEEALRASEERFRRLFESNTLGIIIAELSGRILEVNDVFLDMVQFAREELSAGLVRWDSLTPPEYRELDEKAVEQLRRTGVAQPWEKEYLRKDGTRVPVLIGVAMLQAVSNSCITYIVDLSGRRRLEEQLRQAQKMEAIGRLAGGVAHDFNNLLTVISGFAELLQGKLGDTSPLNSDVGEIRKAADRASSLTRQLLAFSRKQVLNPQVLDLNAVVADMAKILRRVIGEDVQFTTSLAQGLGSVKADFGQIEQVLMNLAVNARDAMPNGGMLTIETANVTLDETYTSMHAGARPGHHVMLAVSDTGTGMDAETKAHLFEPFFTTKEKGKGTGLGLATAYGIIKQSGGYITAYSEPGHGATFKIYLPRVDEEVAFVSTSHVAVSRPRGRETILLVEDEEAVRRLSRTILEAQGYTVLEATSGDQALGLVRSHSGPIHLILTDVVMPGMSGREFGKRIAASHPGTRMLYMSGYTDDAVVRHGVLEPGIAFLQKPFTPSILARKVREVLGMPASSDT